MARIFGYKGFVGCDAFKIGVNYDDGHSITNDDFTDGLVNSPTDSGQLGFVYLLEKCLFNKEAITFLKTVPKGNDDIGDVDIFNSDKGPIFCWMGHPMSILSSTSVGSRGYLPELLDNMTPVDIDIPEGFIEYVDSVLADVDNPTNEILD